MVHLRRAFTLLELLVVLAILIVIAGLALLRSEGVSALAQTSACEASLVTVRNAILGSADSPGYLTDVGALPSSLADLLVCPATVTPFDLATHRGWNGPYLQSGVHHPDDRELAILDPWHGSIVLRIPSNDPAYARLVSAGPDGHEQTPSGAKQIDPTDSSVIGDDLVLYLTYIPGTNP